MSNLFEASESHGEAVLRASNAETLQFSVFNDNSVAKQLLIKVATLNSYKLEKLLAIRLGEANFSPEKTYEEFLPLIENESHSLPSSSSTYTPTDKPNIQRLSNSTEPSFLDQHRFSDVNEPEGKGLRKIHRTFFDRAGYFKKLHEVTHFLKQLPAKRKKMEKKTLKPHDYNEEDDSENEREDLIAVAMLIRRKIKMKKLQKMSDLQAGINPITYKKDKKNKSEDYMEDFKHVFEEELPKKVPKVDPEEYMEGLDIFDPEVIDPVTTVEKKKILKETYRKVVDKGKKKIVDILKKPIEVLKKPFLYADALKKKPFSYADALKKKSGKGLKRKYYDEDEDVNSMVMFHHAKQQKYRKMQLINLRQQLKNDVEGGTLKQQLSGLKIQFHQDLIDKSRRIKRIYKKSKKNMTSHLENKLHQLHEGLLHERQHAHGMLNSLENFTPVSPHFHKFKSWLTHLPATKKMKNIHSAIQEGDVNKFNRNMRDTIYDMDVTLPPLEIPEDDHKGGQLKRNLHEIKVKGNLLKLVKSTTPCYQEYRELLLNPDLKFDLTRSVDDILKDERVKIEPDLRENIENNQDLDEFFDPGHRKKEYFSEKEVENLIENLERDWKESKVDEMREKCLSEVDQSKLYALKNHIEKEIREIRELDPHLYEKLSEDISGNPTETVVEDNWDEPLLGPLHLETPTGNLKIRKVGEDVNEKEGMKFTPHNKHATHEQTLTGSKTLDSERFPHHVNPGIRIKQNIKQHALLDIMKEVGKVVRDDDKNDFLYKLMSSLHHDSFKHKMTTAKLHKLSLPHKGETMFHHLFKGSSLNSLYEHPIRDDQPEETKRLLSPMKRFRAKILPIKRNCLFTHQIKKKKKDTLHYVKMSKRKGGAILGLDNKMASMGTAALGALHGVGNYATSQIPGWSVPLLGYGALRALEKPIENDDEEASVSQQAISGLRKTIDETLSTLGNYTVDGLEYTGVTPTWVKPIYKILTWLLSHLSGTFSISGLFGMYMFGGKLLKILPYIPLAYSSLRMLIKGVHKGLSSLKDSEKKLQSQSKHTDQLFNEKDPNYQDVLGGQPVNSRQLTNRALKASGYNPKMGNFVHDRMMNKSSRAQYPGVSNDQFYNRMMPRMGQAYPPFQSLGNDNNMGNMQLWNYLHSQQNLMKTLSHHNLTHTDAPKPQVLKIKHEVGSDNWQDGVMITLINEHQTDLNKMGLHFLAPFSVKFKDQDYNLKDLATKDRSELGTLEKIVIDSLDDIFDKGNRNKWIAVLPPNETVSQRYEGPRKTHAFDNDFARDNRSYLKRKLNLGEIPSWDRFNNNTLDKSEKRLRTLLHVGTENMRTRFPPNVWNQSMRSLQLPYDGDHFNRNFRKNFNPSGVVETKAYEYMDEEAFNAYHTELNYFRNDVIQKMRNSEKEEEKEAIKIFQNMQNPHNLYAEFQKLKPTVQSYNFDLPERNYEIEKLLLQIERGLTDGINGYDDLKPERQQLLHENALQNIRHYKEPVSYDDMTWDLTENDLVGNNHENLFPQREEGQGLIAPTNMRPHNHIVMHVHPHKWYLMSTGKDAGGSLHSTLPMWDSQIELRGMPNEKLIFHKDRNRFKITRPAPLSFFSHNDAEPENDENLNSSTRNKNDDRVVPKFNPPTTKLIGRLPLTTPTNLNSDGKFKRHYKLFGIPGIVDTSFKKNFHSSSTLTIKNDDQLTNFLSNRDPFIHKSIQSPDSMQPLYSFTRMPEKYV